MTIDLDRLFTDPTLMFYGFEGDHARFVTMSRNSFTQSIFFDRRIKLAEPQAYRVPLDLLLRSHAERGFVSPKLHFIHHVAQCGSTLLARALDLPERSQVVREPFHLRQVAIHGGAGFESAYAEADWRAMLGLSLTMLAKRFVPTAPVVVKGNVPISMIADAIGEADPGQAGILLHFPLDDYCAAVLRSDNHRAWVESVTSELRLNQDPMVGDIDGLSTAEKAGALWFSLVKRYDRYLSANAALRSLDANRLFDSPAGTIVESAKLFGIALSDSEAKAMVDGPLFATYAKSPDQPYDPSLRVERREEAKRDLKADLDAARAWVEKQASAFTLPDSLARPLVGDPAALL